MFTIDPRAKLLLSGDAASPATAGAIGRSLAKPIDVFIGSPKPKMSPTYRSTRLVTAAQANSASEHSLPNNANNPTKKQYQTARVVFEKGIEEALSGPLLDELKKLPPAQTKSFLQAITALRTACRARPVPPFDAI